LQIKIPSSFKILRSEKLIGYSGSIISAKLLKIKKLIGAQLILIREEWI